MLKILIVNKLSILVNYSHSNDSVIGVNLLKYDSHDCTHWLVWDDRVDIVLILP